MAHNGWSCVVDKREKNYFKKDNKGLQSTVSNTFQAHPTKNYQGIHKNTLLNMGVIKKEEEHTNSMLYDNWTCTNVNKFCG